MITNRFMTFLATLSAAAVLLSTPPDSRPALAQAASVCGNNITEPGEVCDGSNLNGYTCGSVAAGFTSGALNCRADCSGWDISQCSTGGHLTAASCSQQDVQAAISVAEDGDTVHVPAGTCTWDTAVTIGTVTSWTPLLFSSKNLTLMGAGIDQTIIIDHTGPGFGDEPLWVQCEAGKPFRITGLTFTGMQRRSSTEPAITIRGMCNNWRIDHVKFDLTDSTPGEQGRGIRTTGANFGLIDHNIFLNTYTGVTTANEGDLSWSLPLSLGTGAAVYIEDNQFLYSQTYQGDGANDAYEGSRYVLRYNELTNARIGHHCFDSGGYRSPHSFEIYNNEIEFTSRQSWYAIRFRGGTGVVYNNTLEGLYNLDSTLGIVNYRTCCCSWCTNVEPQTYGYPCEPYCTCQAPLHTNCSHWGRCDGSNPYDGNLDSSGYPCRDQVGRSTDVDGDGIQNQEPLYEWGNSAAGQDIDITVNDPWGCSGPSMTDHLKENRDFINDMVRPGYIPYPYPHPLSLLAAGAACQAGDINCDKSLDTADILLWIDVFLGRNLDQNVIDRADLNHDNSINALDLQETILLIHSPAQ